jgi:hypothetical protein
MGAGDYEWVTEHMTIEDATPWFSFASYEDYIEEEYRKRKTKG